MKANKSTIKARLSEELVAVNHTDDCPNFSVIHIGVQDESWMHQIPAYCPYCGQKLDEDEIRNQIGGSP